MEKAKKFVEFYKKNGGYPEPDKYFRLWDWYISTKYSSSIEPEVREYLLSEVPDFFNEDDIKIVQMGRAQKFVEFYKRHGRFPKSDEDFKLWYWYTTIIFTSLEKIEPDVRDYLLSEIPDFFQR